MKVLHVITGLATGGAETFLFRLLDSFRGLEFEHHVVVLGKESTLSARVRAAAASLVHLGLSPSRPNPMGLWRLRRLLKSTDPEVVQGWMYHANLAALLASPAVHWPLVWSIRQTAYDLRTEKALTRAVIEWGARLSGRPGAIVYNSTTSARQHAVLGFSTRKSCVIPNGFDTVEFRPDASRRARILSELEVPGGAVVIGIMARLHPMKDHDGFLLAAARFRQEWPNAVFVLAGEGVVRENARIAERVRNLGLEEHVRLCGRREDVAALDAALDIGTLSSAWGEAFPNSIGEAMACGVPCVATDVGDTREIIGDTGEVVAPGDPEALCAAWLRLARLADGDRRALGERARRRIVERYGLPAVTARYAELYRELGGKRSCAA